MMRAYLILITMDDGSTGRLRGLFCSDWAAIDAVLGSGLDGVRSVKPRRETK